MPQPRIPLAINGYDVSSVVNRTGYAIEYTDRMGPNTFLSLAGTEDKDILRTVPTIYWPLNALWLDELQELRRIVRAYDYVPVQYLDLDDGLKMDYFHAVFGRIQIPLITNTGYMAKDGALLTLIVR